MENLENIVFKRLCHFLNQYNFKLKLYRDTYLFTYKDIRLHWWKTKQDIMFTHELRDDYRIAYDSLFTVCKFYYDRRKNKRDNRIVVNELADLWPTLQMFQADSLEEMMIKMDLVGI